MAPLDEIATVVVRDYLRSKGYLVTLGTFDNEARVSPSTKSYEVERIAKQLNIEKLFIRNERESSPLAAILEVILKYFTDRAPSSEAKYTRGLPLIHAEASIPSDFLAASTKSVPPGRRALVGAASSDLLVVEDDIESDTIAGSGRSNLLQKVADIQESFKARRLVNNNGNIRQAKQMLVATDAAPQEQRLTNVKKLLGEKRWTPTMQQGSLHQNEDFNSSRSPYDDTAAAAVGNVRSPVVLASHSLLIGQFPFGGIASVAEQNSAAVAVPNEIAREQYLKNAKSTEIVSRPTSSSSSLKQEGGNVRPQIGSSSAASDRDAQLQEAPNAAAAGSAARAAAAPAVPWMIADGASGGGGPAAPWSQPPPSASLSSARPISVQVAVELKKLVLGSATRVFPDSWVTQAFCFSDVPPTEYGLFSGSEELAPMVAAVQAVLLLEMLFVAPVGSNVAGRTSGQLRPSKEERMSSLGRCLAKALWRAGGDKQATLALPSYHNVISGGGRYKADGITEQLLLLNFDSPEELTAAVLENISLFTEEGRGSAGALLYGLVLSRGIANVADDIAGSQSSSLLVDDRAQCTQNVIGLIVAGRAALDDVLSIATAQLGTNPVRRARSAVGRFDVGLLTVDEHRKRCLVGTRLKTPRYPVWLAHTGGHHYGVLFSLRHELVSDWKAERRFDLYYYDPHGRQDCEIRLTVDTASQICTSSSSEEDAPPPLELCIATKWAGAAISWNGIEPLR